MDEDGRTGTIGSQSRKGRSDVVDGRSIDISGGGTGSQDGKSCNGELHLGFSWIVDYEICRY
jgi:hypothetical protein